MKKILFLACILAIQACSSSSSPQVQDSASQVPVDNETKAAEQTAAPEAFSAFWTSFRQAVLDNNFEMLSSLTQFPFETRGPMDEDPVVKYDQSSFAEVWKAFLQQSTGLSADLSETELDAIRKITQPDSQYVTADQARVADLEFRKVNGSWRFAFAYLNDETIELITK